MVCAWQILGWSEPRKSSHAERLSWQLTVTALPVSDLQFCGRRGMDEEAAHTDVGQKENHMPLPNSEVTTFPHSEEQSLRQQVTSFEEWRTLAGAWPLKRLVALWNDLPGVPPVQKFTNREIALERIWRFLHPPEQTTLRKAAEQKNPFREGSKAAQ